MRKKLTSVEDIDPVVKSMTLDEKICMLREASAIFTDPIEELNIPGVCLADGVTGINFAQVLIDEITKPAVDTESGEDSININKVGNMMALMEEVLTDPDIVLKTEPKGSMAYRVAKRLCDMRPKGEEPTCFPSGVLYGASWSEETAYEGGKALGQEMDAYGVDVVLGPNVDIQRDPLGGRSYECYSEDPYLVGKIASTFIKGIQSNGIAACAKHFAANNQETNRSELNTIVSERALREIYLRGFEDAVKEGGVKTIMSALNKINGVPCTDNEWLLKKILREEWGFEGFVVSDWGAVRNKPKAIKAGNDMILQGPQDMTEVYRAVDESQLSIEDIDFCVKNILRTITTLNCFTGRDADKYSSDTSVSAAYRGVVEGSVLLKNDDALPIKPGSKTVFWGKRSNNLIECGGGSTQVYTKRTSSILGRAVEINGTDNCFFEEYPENAEYFIYTVGSPGHEGADLNEMDIEPEDRSKLDEVLKRAKSQGMKTVVVLNVAGPVDMRRWIDYADAILCIFIPGCEGGNAAADMLFGIEEPAGRLPLTFPKKYLDTPTWINFPGSNNAVMYGEDIYVGYRYYDKKGIEPQFPFGHGLGYTTFEIYPEVIDLTFDAEKEESVSVPVRVKNTGNRRGSTVVQLYVSHLKPTLSKPVKELKGFKKVCLSGGDETTVIINLHKKDFASFDPALGAWTVEPGKYEILVGFSSADIKFKIAADVLAKNPYAIGPDTPFGEVMKNKAAKELILQAVPELSDMSTNPPHAVYNIKLNDILTRSIIRACPDAVQASKIIDDIYKRLEKI